MLDNWGKTIVAALAVMTVMIAVIEFYGGPELQRWTKQKLEDWWLRLSEITIPNVGLAEATFALVAISSLFGRSAFTSRRWLASLAIAAIVTLFVSIVLPLTFTPSPVFWRSAASLLLTLVIANWASLSITHFLLRFSITRLKHSRVGPLAFLGVLVINVLVSLTLIQFTLVLHAATSTVFVFPLSDVQARVGGSLRDLEQMFDFVTFLTEVPNFLFFESPLLIWRLPFSFRRLTF